MVDLLYIWNRGSSLFNCSVNLCFCSGAKLCSMPCKRRGDCSSSVQCKINFIIFFDLARVFLAKLQNTWPRQVNLFVQTLCKTRHKGMALFLINDMQNSGQVV